MDAIEVKKDQLTKISDTESAVNNPALARMVESNKEQVVGKISDHLGPISPDDISIDSHGRVIIKNSVFASVVTVALASPLNTNIVFCDSNHHLVCVPI